jgi:peptidoglycan hydrolase-like protein with peptidoglycan-binding domain
MVKKALLFSLVLVFIISVSGCATARKQKDLEIQGLRNQVSVLDAQIQAKDEEINSLREAMAKTEQVKVTMPKVSKKKVIAEVKSRPNAKQIQIALANAGYNPGRADGKMGRQTRDAIKAFQRANNLPADGKVGKKTWSLLKKYLYQKSK